MLVELSKKECRSVPYSKCQIPFPFPNSQLPAMLPKTPDPHIPNIPFITTHFTP